MKNLALPCFAVLSFAFAAACSGSNSGDQGTSTGGSTASGGSSQGTGGSTASSGGSTSITATPFPFPQNKKPPNCTLTTTANASQSVQSAYNSWKSGFVVAAGSGMRVRRPGNSDDTVSEGMGYGMLAAVYMNDRTTFDGLWTYVQAHFDANKLMNWHITSAGATASDGAGSATDADEDIAYALVAAAKQWGSAAYLQSAKDMINAMYTYEIAGDGMLKPGDGWGSTAQTFPDYFSPAYLRVFATVSGNSNWSGTILDRNYEILKNVSGMYGLVPDKTTTTYQNMGNYAYDACRTPWRIGMDYCFNAEPRAKEYLDKVGAFFNNIGATNIGDGYSLTGSATSNNKNMAFIGPAGVAGMAGFQSLLDGAFNYGAMGGGSDQTYYSQSLRVLTMLMMSGNFIDISKL